MNCYVEEYENYDVLETYRNNDTPVPAGTFRFLFGLLVMFVGFYVAMLSNFTGHGLGFLMILGSPFIFLTDRK